MQIDLLQTRGLKLLYWSFIFFIFHSEIASEILSEESMGKPVQSVLVQKKCLKLSRQEQLGDDYYSIISRYYIAQQGQGRTEQVPHLHG